jgi:hypothetical protein
MRNAIVAMVGLGMILAPVAHAAGVDRAIYDVAYIDDGEGASRILFRVGDLSDLGHFVVSSATLNVTLAGSAEARALDLRIHNVTTDWNAGSVSWTSGWTRPGGDFDDEVYASSRLDLSRGATTASIDLTPLLKETYEAGVTPRGYLITLANTDGLTASDRSRFTNLSTATVSVEAIRVPRSPSDLLANGPQTRKARPHTIDR